MMRLHRHQPRTGSILPLIVIGIIALLGMVALARTQAQDIADLSALAGARQFNGDTSNASNLNNVNGAIAAANDSADNNAILGRAVTTPMISLRTGIYTYDAVQQRFVASY